MIIYLYLCGIVLAWFWHRAEDYKDDKLGAFFRAIVWPLDLVMGFFNGNIRKNLHDWRLHSRIQKGNATMEDAKELVGRINKRHQDFDSLVSKLKSNGFDIEKMGVKTDNNKTKS